MGASPLHGSSICKFPALMRSLAAARSALSIARSRAALVLMAAEQCTDRGVAEAAEVAQAIAIESPCARVLGTTTAEGQEGMAGRQAR